MPPSEGQQAFIHDIDNFINRVKIKYIVCFPPESHTKQKWTKARFKKHRDSHPDKPIVIHSALFLTDRKSGHSQEAENEELQKELTKATVLLSKACDFMYNRGMSAVTLNKLLRESMLKIDSAIQEMTWDKWKDARDPNDENQGYYLLLEKEQIPCPKSALDLQTYCRFIAQGEFDIRRRILHELKYGLVTIYSKYLVYPNHIALPTIHYTCTDTEICELILALSNSKFFKEHIQLRSILQELFKFGGDKFRKTVFRIRSRKGDSDFFDKLAESLKNSLPKKKDTKNLKVNPDP